MSNIGLYIYRIEVVDKKNHKTVPTLSSGPGAKLKAFLPLFINGKTKSTSATERERSWLLKPDTGSTSDCFEGLIKYGTFGMNSEIVDPTTGKTLLNRKGEHIEQIELYYQYMFSSLKPHVALVAIQSYKTWSCVELVNGALAAEFRKFANDDYYLTFKKVMPSELALHANRDVKKITFVKKGVASDEVDALSGIKGEEINLELTCSTRRRKSFGRLSDVTKLLQKNSKNGLLQISENFEATQATAVVRVGKSFRKVGVIGPAVNAGVIDVSDDVSLGANEHPTFSSISKVASQHLADFAAIL